MNPIISKDLSGVWSFIPEGGKPTMIQVPGGGWLKQGFDCEEAAYERSITIPNAGRPQATRLELGAVNHFAQYLLGTSTDNLHPVTSEVTAFTPQSIDLTPYVNPGQTYLLRVEVRAYWKGRPVAPHWAEWSECVARGIFGSAFLRVYPAVYISDIFPKTSVSRQTLSYEVSVTNSSSQEQTATIDGAFGPSDSWRYPKLPAVAMTVPPHCTRAALVETIPWTLGTESYCDRGRALRPLRSQDRTGLGVA